ncbi:LPS-assembly lipoprotein LptE [Legionella jordanis]|uniref:LPS-assembly lipoprotein LptE n=1 Tax=Legionella jordanis TaxID=456 RepID=A0A0W0V7M4_9GAMM|nr:LPS assembly lipoprotein LptE [Legionella jordanis]KTD16123.1 rare lipoprotein B [Legionella jordanis]RMX04649.1 hypothetical protein EAW55_04225 [Legionella jordanis]RMX18359.1 hypothetical protein EAS68_08410 [Legionella jordanis]VEH12417.1 Rare lipoprotein B [Legionella jordanis]HAT8713929.1 hypothetical protein [Legionella jordanis]
MRRLLLIVSFALLSACGFHLRGMTDLPPWLNSVAIIIQNAHSDLGGFLKDQLQAYNIAVVDEPTRAKYWIIIEQDSYRQEITNVSSSTVPRQYLLIYDVQYSLTEAKGKVIAPSSHIMITRQVTINNDRILGSDAEEALRKNEMRRDAAQQILNRLSQIKNRYNRISGNP